MLIIRFYQDENIDDEIIDSNLTLEEAQAHCKDPQTSSKTCDPELVGDRGPWFDGYKDVNYKPRKIYEALRPMYGKHTC